MEDESPYSTKTFAVTIEENKLGSNQVSLVFILLLITCAAILASLFQLSFAATQKTPSLLSQLCVLVGVISSIAGAIVGYCIERRLFSAIIGSITGLGIGIVAGAIGSIPNDYTLRLNQIAFVGSLAMILMTLMSSRLTRRIDGSRLTSIQEKDEK